jgi:hypothetical protein
MDRTTKLLLLLIAGGLWANAWPHLIGRASAQQGDVCLNVGDCLQTLMAERRRPHRKYGG